MTPQRIRILDKWLGRPVCAMLTLLEGLRRRWAPYDRRPPDRVVFIKLIEMGSTVLAAPALAEAAARVGRENVFLMVFRRNRAIADAMELLPAANIIEVDDGSLGRFVWSLGAALRRTRRERIDGAIDLEGLTRASAAITWLTGARLRAGYHNFTNEGPYRGRLFNRELNYGFQRHVAVAFLAMTRALFAVSDERPLLKQRAPAGPWRLPRFVPRPGEGEALLEKIAQLTGQPVRRPIIVLNPNCSDLLPLRRWPAERFILLGKWILRDDPGATVVISGGTDERDASEGIAKAIDPDGQRCLSLAGRTTFRELLTLMALGDALVSNDSGPCHFAALTDIAVVALFGPETAQLYGPIGRRVRVLNADLACSPCVNLLNHRFSPCRDNRCMQALDAAAVYAALRELCPPGAAAAGA